jgi:1,4-dihydroxy-2-naphthoate octaprenyltransferase
LVFGTAALFDLNIYECATELALLSLVFGWMASIYSRSRQIGTMMVDHLAGIKTLASRLGFDRAKGFLLLEVLTLQLAVLGFWWHLEISSQAWLLPLLGVLAGLRLAMTVARVRTPVGSQALALPGEVLYYQLLLGICFALEFLWLAP